jgi:multidrug efflux pump subunit AcrB
VLDACLEVRSAVVYATFAVVLVVLPIMALSGIGGRLFAPLGLSYVLAVMASLIVALTVTPALAMALLARRRAAASRDQASETLGQPGRHSMVTDRTPAGPQHVLPGAEKASTGTMARRAAARPLQARVPQRSCDHGLFSDEADQADLLSPIMGD